MPRCVRHPSPVRAAPARGNAGGIEAQSARFSRRIAELADSPLALHTDAANRQHYEVPAAFFQACLGRR
jgi:cyclopropane-fatty-acyl-phospholipid synthase